MARLIYTPLYGWGLCVIQANILISDFSFYNGSVYDCLLVKMDFSWFWDERFWFPANRSWGWKNLENLEGSTEYRPQIKDLHWAIPFGLCLLVIRFLFER